MNAGGWPVPSGIPSVSAGEQRAAACSAVICSATPEPYPR